MKKEDLRLLIVFGEGSYTGNTKKLSMAFNAKDFDMLQEKVKEFSKDYTHYFSNLDGKHSDVEGVISIAGDLSTIMEEYESSDMNWFDTSARFGLEKSSEAYQSLKAAQDLLKSLYVKKLYRNKKTGVVIDLDDYELIESVVDLS